MIELRGSLTSAAVPGGTDSIWGAWRNTSAVLFSKGGKTYYWSTNGATPTEMASFAIGVSSIAYGNDVYGPISGGVPTPMYQWVTGSQGGLLNPLSNTPYNATAVTVHLDRMFVMGGTKPGTTSTTSPRSIWWTDPLAGGPVPTTVAGWSDDASGLVNEIKLEGSDFDPGIGFARVNGALTLLRRKSVYTLYGQTPSNFSVRRIQGARGCASTGSISEYKGGCYYMSDDGLVWFDGSDTQVVSQAVNSYIVRSDADLRASVTEVLPGDYLFVSVPDMVSPNFVGFSALYHIPSNSWTTIQYNLFDGTSVNPKIAIWGTETSEPIFIGSNGIAAGSPTVPDPIGGGSDQDATSGLPIKIRFSANYAPVRVGGPGEMAQLHRVIPTFDWELGVCPIRMRVGAQTTGSDLLYTTIAVPNDGNTRKQPVHDCFGEADTVYLSYDRDLTTSQNLPIRIYDTVIEYQEARQRQQSP